MNNPLLLDFVLKNSFIQSDFFSQDSGANYNNISRRELDITNNVAKDIIFEMCNIAKRKINGESLVASMEICQLIIKLLNKTILNSPKWLTITQDMIYGTEIYKKFYHVYSLIQGEYVRDIKSRKEFIPQIEKIFFYLDDEFQIVTHCLEKSDCLNSPISSLEPISIDTIIVWINRPKCLNLDFVRDHIIPQFEKSSEYLECREIFDVISCSDIEW